ncbi:uncharacterized protein LOC129268793 [Lytechinus pictus]|uniref:uncharacterized protein LOC129268793 n=1 Tax=Lytechinus pictus TaxID=7653 RepID=UPI0030BA2592
MGCCCSANDEEPTLGEHSTLPTDVIPYKGPILQYAFVDMRVIGTTYMGRNLKTDLVPHYTAFQEPYTQGFRLVLLKTVPGVFEKLRVQYGMERRYYIPLQASFVRPVGSPATPTGQVKIVQTAIEFNESVLSTNQENVQAASEVARLREFDTVIEENGREGYQLVSFEPSGYTKKTTNVKETVLQMDLLFHRSNQSTSGSFIYQSVIIPVSYTAIGSSPVSRRQIYELSTDVTSRLVDILQQGWKIVDTNYLSSHLQGQFRPTARTLIFNTMWVFEKPSTAVNDLQPRWECTVIKYKHVVKFACNRMKATTTWQPLVVEMGHHGWELACILDTAEATREGRLGSKQTLLIVFQRPLR